MLDIQALQGTRSYHTSPGSSSILRSFRPSLSRAQYLWLAHDLSASVDAIIHTRITNDEKALRRVTKRFHAYTNTAYTSGQLSPGASTSVDDAREAFLVELGSFHLSLKKSLMVCEAEARQVEEYQRERERIGACGDINFNVTSCH